MTDVGISALTPQPAPLVPPVDGTLGQTPAEKAAALAAAQAAAAAIRPPDLTRANAVTEIEKLKRDPEFAKKLHAGATEETKRWRELHKTASAPAETDADDELAQRVMTLQKFGFPALDSEAGKDLLAAMSGKPISIETRRAVEAKRSALMADRGFVQKYLDGDQEARGASS
jgi:hypothetical protein